LPKTKKSAATAKSKKASPAAADSSSSSAGAEEARFLGCVGSEGALVDRVYNGGPTGASYNLALHHAKTARKKYFAIARGGGDGHAFAFSSLDMSKGGFLQGGGCERPCTDLEDTVCGCIDGACTGPVPRGEEHNRRWAVYEMIKK
jgi:dolichyl-diphosphooligosaccharide---protein glycosyltransferase